MSEFLQLVQSAANSILAAVAVVLLFWKIMLPHFRKSIIGRMEPLEEKVDQIHQKTTVNHHSSAEPTILDMIDDVKSLLEEHIEDSKKHVERLDKVEAEQQRVHPSGPSIMIRLPKLPFTGQV